MKNAMKKLFSLALAAMLLVSVVPMGAMASEVDPAVVPAAVSTTNNVYLTIKDNGKTVVDQNLGNQNDGTTVYQLLTAYYPDPNGNNYSAYDVAYLKDGVSATYDWTINDDNKTDVRIEIVLTTKSCNVGLTLGNNRDTKLYPYGSTVTLNESLLTHFNMNLHAGKAIEYWMVGNQRYENGASVTLSGPVEIVCYQHDAGTSGGGNNGSTLYRCFLNYFDANGKPVRQDIKDVKPNEVVNLGNDVQSYMIESGAKDNGANSVVITENNATISVYLKGNSSVTPPTGNTKFYYTVYIYDWNGKLIKDGATYDANPYQNVTVQADNFDSMKVNGVQLGQGVNYFTLNQNETRVDVTTTTNSGNNPGVPGQNTVNVYFKGADKTSTVYTTTVVKGNSIGHDAVMTAKNAVGEKSGYNFAGWQRNGEGSTLASETVAYTTQTNDVTYYPVFTPKNSKFVNDIYLNIFVNGKADVPAKSVKLNDYTIISDDVINLDEVLTVVDDYYKASNTNKGLQLDGLYVAKGNFVSNWATDSGKSSSISGLKAMRYDSVVGINVMVNNAVAKTSSNADSSNPKTGDDIYMTVTVMGLSAAALCAVYYISKKRAVR